MLGGHSLKRLLITGISGLLGSNIAAAARDRFETSGIYFRHPFRMKGIKCFQKDLTKEKSFEEFENINPNFIIHCAALTDVDYCEEHPEEAYKINNRMSILVAEKAKKIDAYLIHISTDFVFNGTKRDYREENIPNPISVYGKTKLAAEQNIMSILSSACIIRTTIYGWNYQKKFSLAEWMIYKLKEKKKFPALRDVRFSPILVNDLAEILFMLEAKKYGGLIHIGSRESCSKFEFALSIAKIFGFDQNLVEPVNVDQLEFKAPRGRNNSLNVRKAEKILSVRLPSVEDGLRKMKKLQENGFINGLRSG